jgi:hypothetical protein
MSFSVLIEAVKAEGFGGGGVVAVAFGDVREAAGLLDGLVGPGGGGLAGIATVRTPAVCSSRSTAAWP